MYDSSDPRSRMASGAAKPVSGFFTPAEYGRYYEEQPRRTDGARTWFSRGQNFLVAYSQADAGAVFERQGQVDEYVLLLPDRDHGAVIDAPEGRTEVDGFSLVILPPGNTRITLPTGGRAARIFSTRSPDLVAMCSNATSFSDEHPRIPPFRPWPAPPDGYKVRAYSLDIPKEEGRFGRIFRCTTLMVNYLDPQYGPRDIAKLSPHHHDDFEQGSLALDGAFTHHIRWPWTTDLNAWREDEHAYCKAPSLTVIPPPSIHTSRGMDEGLNQLVDIFSPPRFDFSKQPGWVLNADEYPMPPEQ
ncbi:MAG: hypothetical protein K5872_09010 [Rhizobiaceae bacterium]|nr:hypothetical protein [Rhizobiaceae bacterium]MCV0406354.1 hypothetical protein [Rhizobiaceae bacterium]